MARFDSCPNCDQAMPAGNLHCFGCGLDLPPPVLDNGSVLVQIYPGISQAAAFDFYRTEVSRLAAAGWYPIAHSWGDDRMTAGFGVLAGDAASSRLVGTLMVTYRQEGHA